MSHPLHSDDQEQDIRTNLAALPAHAYSVHPSDDCLAIIVEAGRAGYNEVKRFKRADQALAYVLDMNRVRDVTSAQERAMVAGSMFGWHVPGAHPDTYAGEEPAKRKPTKRGPAAAKNRK